MGQTETKIKKFIQKANRRLPLEQVILFGSRAREDHLEESDIDLIFISENFAELPFFKRPCPFYDDWHWEGGPSVELFCYTPSEFKKKTKQIGMVRDAAREGKILYKK